MVSGTKHTPAARYQTYIEEQKQKEDDEFEKKANEKFGKQEDPVKKARERLGQKAFEKEDGTLPTQRNQHRLEFTIEEVKNLIASNKYNINMKYEQFLHFLFSSKSKV